MLRIWGDAVYFQVPLLWSGYSGVIFNKKNKNWNAYISIRKKKIYLGVFNNSVDAAKAYNKAALKYHGEFARLNKI